MDAESFFATAVVGLGATLFMDLWALVLKHTLDVPSANYCLVGRWLGHMPQGTFRHRSIALAPPKASECTLGWIAHYVIGMVYALVLVRFVSGSWLARPTLLPAMLFGTGSVLVPFLIMQPSFGLGIAASKSPKPMEARARSVMAHMAFGLGLYLSAVGVSHVLSAHS